MAAGRQLFACLTLGVAMLAVATEQTAQYLVVEKQARRLTLFRDGEALKTYRVALGGNPVGHKQHEGDQRTPEGTYSIDFKNPDSAYHLSLKISYPNGGDVARARNQGMDPGGMIMIHGVGEPAIWRNGQNDWTDGCIAVSNEEIEEIWELVEQETPIVIRP
jgi:murein L,D-transpeptidase YafK